MTNYSNYIGKYFTLGFTKDSIVIIDKIELCGINNDENLYEIFFHPKYSSINLDRVTCFEHALKHILENECFNSREEAELYIELERGNNSL